jgi:CubicO group peptidase (beta-lactamase class C family)
MKRVEFERVTPESVGIPSEAVHWLLDQLESGFTEPHGLMLMRYGKIFAEGWWSPYAPGIRHGLQSHTKTYAATAVGIAYTEGLLSLSERIIDIFPELSPADPSENLKRLTIHHVLSMGCGMDDMPRPALTGSGISWRCP